MKILQTYLISPIWWRLSKDDSKFLKLDTLNGLKLLNPLLYPDISNQLAGEKQDNKVFIRKNKYCFKSNILLFASEKLFKKHDPKKLCTEELPHFINNVRFCSKQIAIQNHNLSFVDFVNGVLPNIKYPEQTEKKGSIRKQTVETAVTFSNLKRADEFGSKNGPEVFHSLLFDAIDAASTEDFRKALLYCAMATETIANTKLEEKYLSLIKESPDSTPHRILEFEVGGGETKKKDPIFKSLQQNSSFSSLLHELPLYLFGKSLLTENESVYRNAVKLYRTRNKIVHSGEPPEEDDYFGYYLDDTKLALQTSLKIFEWYGESEEYYLPFEISFVEFNQAKLQ